MLFRKDWEELVGRVDRLEYLVFLLNAVQCSPDGLRVDQGDKMIYVTSMCKEVPAIFEYGFLPREWTGIYTDDECVAHRFRWRYELLHLMGIKEEGGM